jgi:hypothetical protein
MVRGTGGVHLIGTSVGVDGVCGDGGVRNCVWLVLMLVVCMVLVAQV